MVNKYHITFNILSVCFTVSAGYGFRSPQEVELADIRDHPYHAALMEDMDFKCSAAIIGLKTALTAAHCILVAEKERYFIAVGMSTLSRFGDWHPVNDVIVHPKFKVYYPGESRSDIAVVKIKDTFIVTESVQIISLYHENLLDHEERQATVTTWTKKEDSDEGEEYGDVSEMLQKTSVHILSAAKCEKDYPKSKTNIFPHMLCVSDSKGRCIRKVGDGSPIVVDGKLAGIVAWSNDCVDADLPTVGIAVSRASTWIMYNNKMLGGNKL